MKKMMKILEVFFKSTALLIIIVGCSFLLLAVSPRQVDRGEVMDEPTVAEYFDAESAEKIITATGEMRLVVTIDKINVEHLIAKCKLLAERNKLSRLVITFFDSDKSVAIVIDNNYDAYVETV